MLAVGLGELAAQRIAIGALDGIRVANDCFRFHQAVRELDALARFRELPLHAFLARLERLQCQRIEQQRGADSRGQQDQQTLPRLQGVEARGKLAPLVPHGVAPGLPASAVARLNSRKRGRPGAFAAALFLSGAGAGSGLGRLISSRAMLRPASTSSRFRRWM